VRRKECASKFCSGGAPLRSFQVDNAGFQFQQFRLKGVHLLGGGIIDVGYVRFKLAEADPSGLLVSPEGSNNASFGVVRALVNVLVELLRALVNVLAYPSFQFAFALFSAAFHCFKKLLQFRIHGKILAQRSIISVLVLHTDLIFRFRAGH
jgi:hypothetical protein